MATRYWVGDGGTWNDSSTTHWAASPGGASGASAPTISDDVIFDANSFSSGSQIVTMTSGAVCRNMTWTGVTNTPSTGGNLVTCYGNVVLSNAMTWSPAAELVMIVNSGTSTLTTDGLNIQSIFTQSSNGSGGILSLQDDLTCHYIRVSKGTFTTNDFTINTDRLEGGTSSSSTVVMNLGASEINLTATSIGSALNFSGSADSVLTVNGEDVVINITVVSETDFEFGTTSATTTLTGSLGTINLLSVGWYCVFQNGITNLVINELYISPDCEVRFASGNGNPFEFGYIEAVGDVGQLITFTTTGVSPTILQSTIEPYFDYIDVEDNTAFGDHIPFVAYHGVNSGGNTNWIFPPFLTSISPTSGYRSGGNTVVATGIDFVIGATSITVDATTIPAAEVTINEALTTATFIMPAHAVGATTLFATNAVGDSNTKTYTYLADIGDLPTYNTSLVSAVAKVPQNLPFPQFVLGARNAGSYALFKKSTTYGFHVWRSEVYKIGREFDFVEMKFYVKPALTSNMTIIPVLYFDNEAHTAVGKTINSTNYPNGETLITLTQKNFQTVYGHTNTHGKTNFFVEFQSLGTALATVILPITIDIEVNDN